MAKVKQPYPTCAGIMVGMALAWLIAGILGTAVAGGAAGVTIGIVCAGVYFAWVVLGFLTGRYAKENEQ